MHLCSLNRKQRHLVENTQYSSLIAGCGYLGLRAARAWNSQGRIVHAITRSAGKTAQFQSLGLRPLLMDLSAPKDSNQLPAADTVLWAVGMDRSADIPREQIWIDGLSWLLNQLPQPPRRFIYISSTSVYGSRDGDLIDENSSTNPGTEGGACCVKAEQLVRQHFADARAATEVVVLRMAGIYGPDRLLRRVIDLKAGTALPGAADQWLNLIHVDDAVRMVQHVTTADKVPPVINVVNSGTLTRQQYYSQLASLSSSPAPTFGGAESNRQRGGNKRVTSIYDELVEFRFDDVNAGLQDSWDRSTIE